MPMFLTSSLGLNAFYIYKVYAEANLREGSRVEPQTNLQHSTKY